MTNYNKENNPILKLTYDFALEIIAYCDQLDERRKYVLSKQLFKSGTSIGANASEAQHAESKADFIHKFKIAPKEMKETAYWLSLCKHSVSYPDCDDLIQKMTEIDRVINKIISTSKKNNPLSYLASFFIFF